MTRSSRDDSRDADADAASASASDFGASGNSNASHDAPSARPRGIMNDETYVPEPDRFADGQEASLQADEMIGEYRVIKPLGKGAMGEVYLAFHEHLNQRYAIKLLPQELSQSSGFVKRFRDEAQTLARLDHPNIVRIHYAGVDSGRYYLVMEYVDGGSLDEYLEEQGGRLGSAETADILEQTLEGLDYAHTHADGAVIHRDLKPANLLRTSAGRVKISDFGLARVVGEEYIQSLIQKSLTLSRLGPQALQQMDTMIDGQSGGRGSGGSGGASSRSGSGGAAASAYVGTIHYMSPEVQGGREADARSDVYAVGVMAYYFLTGRKPLGMAKPASRIIKGLNTRWDRFISRCLETEPEERYDSARAAQGALKPLLGAGRKLAPVAAAVGAALLLGALGFAGASFFSGGDGSGDAPEPRPGPLAQASAATASTSADTSANGAAPSEPERFFTLTVDPPDARVWLGKYSAYAITDGQARLSGLSDGEHELYVQAPGHQAYNTLVTVTGGEGSHSAKLSPIKGALEVQTDPGATVVVEDAQGREIKLGETDAQGRLVSDNLLNIGTYTVRLSKARYQPVEQAGVELIVGRTVKVERDLEPLPGELRVFSTPQGARITINGEDRGETSTTIRDVPAEQELVVEAHKRGYRRQRETLTLEAQETRTLNFGTLVAESGSIRVEVANAGLSDWRRAEVSALRDGREVLTRRASGASTLLEDLELGTYEARVTHPDYEPWSESGVAVRDQQTTEVTARLEPRPGSLTVEVSPAGADWTLQIDGQRHEGRGRATFAVAAEQTLSLKLTAKGYKAVEKQSRIPANGSETWRTTLEEAPGPQAGSNWTVELPGGGGLELLWIAPGTFTMGLPSGESGRDSDEGPQHRVTLTQGYWMGKYEVTQGQYEALMGSNPSRYKNAGEQAPVEQVSWNDAMSFCEKLTERERRAGRLPEGYKYTLPTEAQWEYACRAGTTGAYAGDLDRMGWYGGNSNGTTHPVGQKQPNSWGLYDMHGNVYEWCLDWYGGYPGGSVTDPTGPGSGSNRVNRGGSWNNDARNCRSANRSNNSPDLTSNYLGFRLALSSMQ